MKKKYLLALLISILYFSNTLFAQTNVDVANATEVTSFPYVEENFNSANGGSASGMSENGGCQQILCCSVLVYQVILPVPGSLRADFDDYTHSGGSIIAYTPLAGVTNPTTWSDLEYFNTAGNLCGFRDSTLLGRGITWDEPDSFPDRSGWHPDPSLNHHSVPAGSYYLLVFNENQVSGIGIGDNFKLTIRFEPLCPSTAVCGRVNAVDCTGEGYTGASGQIYSTSGEYTDTLLGGAQGGLDSITYLSLDIQHSALTQNIFPDTSLCIDDTLRQTALTNYVSYLDFDGSAEYVDIDAVSNDLDGSNRSAFMWMKKSTTVSGSAQVLFAINTSSGGNICNLQIGTNEELQIYDGSNSQSTGVTVTDGLWHYVGYTYDDASGETKIYIDNNLVLTFTNSQSSTSTSKFSLGQEFDSGLAKGNFYSGLMSEVSIWKTVLSSSDITLAMNAAIETTHPQYSNLLSYYPGWLECDEEKTVLKDFSSNSNNGTASGSEVIQTNVFEQISNFNSAAWYTKKWNSTNLGLAFSTANGIEKELTTADTFTLVLKRDYVTLTENWIVAPQPITQPEIEIKGNNVNIENGDVTPDTTDYTSYGNVSLGSGNVSRTFTIKNTGNMNLDISNVNISGNSVSDFSITTSPSSTLSSGASTSLIIEFSPTSIGLRTVTVEISNSDCNEGVFQFDIQAGVLGVDVSEKRGQMFTLNGTSDHIIIDNVADAMVGQDIFTIEAWINADASQSGNDRIVAVNTSGYGNVVLFYLDDGILKTFDGSTTRTYGSTDLRGLGWHHVALTFDDSNFKVYLDGVQQGSNQSGSVSTFAANNRWSIGQEWDSGASKGDYFKGKMDEVRIWKDVRTQSEIREKMHLTFSSEEILAMTNLVAYYQFDNDEAVETADGVKDVMGNHGTSTGGTYSNSEVAVGYGKSAAQTVTTADTYTFTETDLELIFSTAGGESLPNDEIVVTKIVTEKPKNVSANELTNDPEVYWVINNYGTNTNLGATVKFTFGDGAIDDNITTNHSVHKRASNDFEATDWADIEPDSVNATSGNNHICTTVTSFSQFSVSSSTSDFLPISLPVELVGFDARRSKGEDVNLTWQTATETNNKGFYIERSQDARQGFEPIAWIDGKGTSDSFSFYQYTDKNNFEQVSYYRLKQVDFDGAISYSEVRAVVGLNSNSLAVSIYPNPTNGDLKVEFKHLSNKASAATIKIMNTSGQVLSTQTHTIEDIQVINLTKIRELAPSIYFISIELDDGERILKKFIKR